MQNIKTSDLEEFKRSLETSISPTIEDIDVSEGYLSEEKINSLNPEELISRLEKQKNEFLANASIKTEANSQKIKVDKNVIVALKSDSYGCGWIRCTQWFTYLDSVYGRNRSLLPMITPAYVTDEQILIRTRSIYLQRAMIPPYRDYIRRLKENQKRFQYKLVADMDDQILDYTHEGKELRGVPEYNYGNVGITKEVQQSYIDIMGLVDEVTVSTENLKTFLQKEAKIKTPITVIENVVSKYIWNDRTNKKITEKIRKPKILLTSSATHYSNQNKMTGDFSSGWIEYLVKNVSNNKIDLVVIGGLPWFLEEIKDKCKVIGWLNSYDYPRIVMEQDADFCLMPLIPNQFNCSKSDLKHLECSAAGIIGIGADFTYRGYKSPYHYLETKIRWNCSAKELEDMIEYYSSPEQYNRVIENNLKYLEENGRWLESKKFIEHLVSIF